MKWQKLNGLKSNEIMLLSYIYKYHRIDLIYLQKELDLPSRVITSIVQKLYDNGYINYLDESKKRTTITVTDKIEKKYVTDWDKWTKVNKDKLEKKEDFLTNMLYVPPQM